MIINSPPLPLIDVLKAIASQVIVLHHLAIYGPLPAAARELVPGAINWLDQYGRIAVQVFLVIGGFLAARSLSPRGEALTASPLGLIGKRYLRLAVPYFAALGLAVVCATIAATWMVDESIPAPATFRQGLAHVFLLQDLLEYESLSAGLWYVAIDFQLFALLALVLWLGPSLPSSLLLVVSLVIASLFWFNRDPSWDSCALYFFGSYGLGAAAWWASDRKRGAAWLVALACVAVVALLVDFRLRIAVALAVALVLGFGRRSGLLQHCPTYGPVTLLSRIAYAVFLVHFPLCLVVNALFARLGFSSPAGGLAGMLAAWAASIGAAMLVYRWIERPVASRLMYTAGEAGPGPVVEE